MRTFQTPADAPNSIWSADFKGHFKSRDGIHCYPLTVQDGFSRYLLACQSLMGTTFEGSKAVFRRVFQEFGLPERIRTDNGSPFASIALGRRLWDLQGYSDSARRTAAMRF